MADWTPQQLQQMNAVVMGTHDRLTPGGQIQPGYTLDQIYGGILPAASASRPAMASNQPTPAQLAAMKAIPAGSYQTPPNRPILSPNTPAGSQFQDTGNYGRASGSMLEQLMLAGQPQPLNITVRGGQQQPIGSKIGNQMFGPPMPPNVPLPRSRPGYAPTAIDMAAINRPVGANPGMGGAMLGNGVMAPGIAPQGPPPPGIAPTVWAGDPPPQAPATNNTVRGGQQPPRLPSSALQYAQANRAAQLAALERQSNATGTAGGYQYVGGQKVGYAPQTIGNNVYTPTNPATAYGLANAAAQIAALNRQAAATGSTGVYNYVNGVKTGTVNGQSSANAYAAANAGPGSVAEWERRASGGGGGGSSREYGGGAG
jgi:hypothetical protein